LITTLLRLPDVIRATGLSRSAIYRLEAAGKFPPRVRVSARATAWRSDLVSAWIDARPRAVDSRIDQP
jgi:prophage regulatory protein